jgi:hypothetical protein
MPDTTSDELRQLLRDMSQAEREALVGQIASIAALKARKEAAEARRDKAAAAAAEIAAAASVPELQPEPDIIAANADRLNALIDGAESTVPPHVERAKRRERNEARAATREQLRHDADALAVEAARLAADVDAIEASLKRMREAFLRASIEALVNAARVQMVRYIRGAVQLGVGLRDALHSLGGSPSRRIDDVTDIKVSFWPRAGGFLPRQQMWPLHAAGSPHPELMPFAPAEMLAAFEAALSDDETIRQG